MIINLLEQSNQFKKELIFITEVFVYIQAVYVKLQKSFEL